MWAWTISRKVIGNVTERKMVSRAPTPTGNVGRSFGDSNKESIHGLNLRGREVRSGEVLGVRQWQAPPLGLQHVVASCKGLPPLPMAQLVDLALAWPSS